MISYQVEDLALAIPEMQELFNEHWEEVACNQEVIKLDPDWDSYYTMIDSGITHLVTAREGGILLGYFLCIITRELHYKNIKTANTDIFFLKKEHRNGFAGIKLFKVLEKTLKDIGVNKINTATKLSLDIGPMLERLGYTPVERLYSKLI